jgi:hypothetical protein
MRVKDEEQHLPFASNASEVDIIGFKAEALNICLAKGEVGQNDQLE